MAFRLPQFTVLKSNYYSSRGHFYYKEADGSVVLGEPSVLSTLVKIEVEPADSNNRYVHLRFSHFNRYWQRQVNGRFIVCQSTKPEEDTSKLSCTLFEPVQVPNRDGIFYLKHVPSGGRLVLDNLGPASTMRLYVSMVPIDPQGYLTFVNWSELVNLPERVAFKGDNDLFLEGVVVNRNPFLKFSSGDPNARSSGHQIIPMNDGLVRIKSDHFDRFWRRSPNWIWADSSDTTAGNRDTLFRPVKVDDNTIGLINLGNNLFCKRLTAENNVSCLNAAEQTLTIFARLRVQEQVLERTISNVRYRMQDARIFGEAPYVAGSATLFNDKSTEATLAVSITYTEESSYTFSRSLSLTSGVTSSITFNVPVIISEASIEVTHEISTTMQWENTTSTSTSVTAETSIPVPASSSAIISYVGTKGSCSIPFHYRQVDRRSTDGGISDVERTDGIYTGVNCYNFQFVVEKIERLA